MRSATGTESGASVTSRISVTEVIGHQQDNVGFLVRRVDRNGCAKERRRNSQQRQAVVSYFFRSIVFSLFLCLFIVYFGT